MPEFQLSGSDTVLGALVLRPDLKIRSPCPGVPGVRVQLPPDGPQLECVLCGHTHESNQYIVRRVLGDVFSMTSFSKSCRRRWFNTDSSKVLQRVIDSPRCDANWAELLEAKLEQEGRWLVCHPKGSFYLFSGHCWKLIHETVIGQEVRSVVEQMLVLLG